MKIKFRQSGGFAGVLRGCDLDTASLPPQEARELEQLVHAAGLSQSSQTLSPGSRDRLQYDIELKQNGDVGKVQFDDGSVPQNFRPLLQYLKKKSHPVPLD